MLKQASLLSLVRLQLPSSLDGMVVRGGGRGNLFVAMLRAQCIRLSLFDLCSAALVNANALLQ